MGSIVKTYRPLLLEERDFLANRADPRVFGVDAATLALLQDAIEFQITVDRILKPPAPSGLAEERRLYLLEVAPSLSLGFEMCFMDGALVTGDFPRASVHIAFASIGGKAIGDWPAAYAWSGGQVAVRSISKEECPPDDRILSVYRSDWLDAALESRANAR